MNEVAVINEGEARRITERICILLDSAASALDRLASLVNEAYAKRVDKALGYTSWAEYAEHEFAGHTVNLAAPIRRELVWRLSESGMSTRAIAPAVNVSNVTVAHDRQVLSCLTPERAEPQIVTGIDGKSYSKPKPELVVVDATTGEILDGSECDEPQPVTLRKSPRRPLTDQFTHAIVQLDKDVTALSRLIGDDRFNANKKNIALTHKSDVQRAVDRLTTVLDALQ